MSRQKVAALAAALAAVCGASATFAAGAGGAESPADAASVFTLEQPHYLQDDEINRRPLMHLLDQAGIAGPLDDARIELFGHIEASYTYNTNEPDPALNLGRVFDLEDDTLLLNQATFNAQRLANVSGDEFDWGFRMEWLYGSDARFTQSNGLFDYQQDDPPLDPADIPGPNEQWDLLQAYVDLNLPVGTGLRIRAGKFTYFKTIDPTVSPFYSRTFSFGNALPFTLTGMYGTYAINEDLTVELGFSRGWDQSLEDNNDAIDAFGSVRFDLSDDTRVALKWITGPELPDNEGAYRTALDLTLSHRLTDQLTLAANGIVGHQAGSDSIDVQFQGPGTWYGMAGYVAYILNDYVTLNGRVEWFRDEDGVIIAPVSQSLYGVTLGATLTPFPNDDLGSNLKIRPEVRYDYSSEAFFLGDADTQSFEHDQFTVALEAFFTF